MTTTKARTREAADWVTLMMEGSFKRTVVMGLALTAFALSEIGETRVYASGAWKRRGRPDIAPPEVFVLGTTEPTALNTGPRLSALQTFGSQGSPFTYTIATPGIFERFIVYGRINVTAAADVTINDVTVVMQASATQINGIQFNSAETNNCFLNFVRVLLGDLADKSEQQSTSVRGRGFEAYRCDFSGTVDGMQLYTPSAGTTRRTVKVLGCYVHDLPISDSPAQGDLLTHNDCFQILGYINVEIRGCALWGGRTSCIILNVTVSGGYGYVTIEENWMYGYPTEGATINVSTSGNDIPTLSIKKNRIDRNGNDGGQISVQNPNRKPASFGATGTTGNTSDWVYGVDKNYYMDDGSTVLIQNG